MRSVLIGLILSLSSSLCFAQRDSSKTTQEPVQRRVFIPGVNTPVSGPGMTAQVPVNTPAPVTNDGKERKIAPPSDPRSFGVSIPLKKAKKDTLRN